MNGSSLPSKIHFFQQGLLNFKIYSISGAYNKIILHAIVNVIIIFIKQATPIKKSRPVIFMTHY